jgi:methylornithine synthase
VLGEAALAALAATGAEWYACYQETHARDLYERLRVGQDFDERAQARLDAAAHGMLVEDGMLLGVGETVAERAHTVTAMRGEPLDQVRVMTFVPQRGTPLGDRRPAGRLGELVTIATMRLAMPDRLIPASLDVDGIAGLESRIAAGANVVTSLVPPHTGLAGVSQSELDIDEGLRTAPVVMERLAQKGLRAASAAEYAGWVAAARGRRAAAGRPA